MKILQITEVWPSAITRMAKQIVKYNTDIEIKLVTFHPKKPDSKEQKQVQELWKWADLVDIQYWKSGAKIKELYPDLWKTKKKILTHYNPYNLLEDKWEDYRKVIVVNNYQKSVLTEATLIPLCIELDFYPFNRANYTTEPIVNMSVNRIEGKKGVIEVAQSCSDLGYRFLLVGRISDGEYMGRVKKAAGKCLDFRQSVSDEEVRKAYYESAVHVFNSKDNFESGSLPVLESMACGLPVLARRIGHVPDLYDGTNMHINEANHEDVDALKKHLKFMMDDRRYRIQLRLRGEETVKPRSAVWRAAEYRKVYEELV